MVVMHFDKKCYQYFFFFFYGDTCVTAHPIISTANCILSDIAEGKDNRKLRAKSRVSREEWKKREVLWCNVSGGEVERIRMRRVFKGGFHGFPWGITTTLRRFRGGCWDVSRRGPSVVESCILRRLLTGPYQPHPPISFAGCVGGNPRLCPFNMQPGTIEGCEQYTPIEATEMQVHTSGNFMCCSQKFSTAR